MTDSVLWRKQASIVMMLARKLSISPERALDVFYTTKTYQQLVGQKCGLHLMSDGYLVENLIAELRSNGIKDISWSVG